MATDPTCIEPPNTTNDAVRKLLRVPNILDAVADAIAAGGYAGDLGPPLIAYLAITSRLLDRPMNVAFVAQSSSGKTRAVEAAIDLMSKQAVYFVSASSPKALIHSPESFQHRTIVFAEADSIPDDGPAASALRALITDNEMVYDTSVQSPSGEWTAKRIVKPGPTGLITTSTKPLKHQLGTRILEISIADDPDQTRQILLAQAAEATGRGTPKVDTASFIDLQVWLETHGNRCIYVPFAESLAALVPDKQVRVRRDFPQLLTAIKTMAFLHQANRQRDDGCVIASLDDYEMARRLLTPVFSAVAEDGVTPAIRQTVEAIRADERGVSQTELCKRLGLAKSTISERVSRAIGGGWLVNDEWREGQPALLRLGDPLPDSVTALPSTETVAEAFERQESSRRHRVSVDQ